MKVTTELRREVTGAIKTMAKKSFRTLSLGYKILKKDEGLVFILNF